MAFDRSPENVARILSHSRLFHGLPPASLFDLIANARVDEFPAGSELEIPINELRVILEGDLRCSDGTTLGRGNSFGENTLLDLALAQELDVTRVSSQDGCVSLVLAPAELNAWLERHPQLQAVLYHHLSQELFNRLSQLSQAS